MTELRFTARDVFAIHPDSWVSALELLGLSAGWYDEPQGRLGAVCTYLVQTPHVAVYAQVAAAFGAASPEVQVQVNDLLAPVPDLPSPYQDIQVLFNMTSSPSIYFYMDPTSVAKMFLKATFPGHLFHSSWSMCIAATPQGYDRGVWTHKLDWDDGQPVTVRSELFLSRTSASALVFRFSDEDHFIAKCFNTMSFHFSNNVPSMHDFSTLVKSPMRRSDLGPEYDFYISQPKPWLQQGAEWSDGFLDRKLARLKQEPLRPPGSSLMVDGTLRPSLTSSTPVTVLIKGSGYPWSYCCSGNGSMRARVVVCEGDLASLWVQLESTPFGLPRMLLGQTHNKYGDLAGTVSLRPQPGAQYPLPEHEAANNSVRDAWSRTTLLISINREPTGFKDVGDYVSSPQFAADVFFRNETGPPSDVELYRVRSVEAYIQSKVENKRDERKAQGRVHKRGSTSSDWSYLKRVVESMRDMQPPEVCTTIANTVSSYSSTSCRGDPGCHAVKREFEQARLQHDAACFRVAEPDDVAEAVALLGDTLYRGFGGFFDLLPSNPITAASAGWSYNNEKYVTFDFIKAASYANLIGTSLHVRAEWSCIVKLSTATLAAQGAFKQGVVYDRYRSNVGTQITMDKRLHSLYDTKKHFVRVVKRLFPEEKATKIAELVGLLRNRVVMAVGQDQFTKLQKAAASLLMFEEAVWTPAVAAPDNAFASAILETRIYHESFMPRVQKKDKRRGRADRPIGIDADTPHFLLQGGIVQQVGVASALTPEAAAILQNKLVQDLASAGLPVNQATT